MATYIPRKAYTQDELAQLYPKELELQLVQVVSRRSFPLVEAGTRELQKSILTHLQLLRHGMTPQVSVVQPWLIADV
jgi:hypothetical protein